MAYPTILDSLNNIVPGTAAGVSSTMNTPPTTGSTIINALNGGVNALETKVGIDNSLVVTTIDYLLKNTGGGHNHDGIGSKQILATGLSIAGLASNAILQVNAGGTAISSTGLIPPSSAIVGISDTQTISNKVNIGTDTGTQTLQNKTISTGSILDANADPSFSYHSMSRQAIINPAFQNWQRLQFSSNTTTNPSTSTYTADQWKVEIANTGVLPATIIHSQQTHTPGDIAGAYYFYRINVNSAGSGFGNNDYYRLTQPIESATRNLCGLSRKITLSFYAKSSIASYKLGYAFGQNYGTGGSPTAEESIMGGSVTLTTSWVKYTVSVTTNTLIGKTFGTNNDDSFKVYLFQMWGTTIGINYGLGVASSFVGSGNIDISQIQLCSGGVSLPYQPTNPADDLNRCKRYYQIAGFTGQALNVTSLLISAPFNPQLRVATTNVIINTNADGSGTDGSIDKYGTGSIVVISPTLTSTANYARQIVPGSGSPFVGAALYDGSIKVDVAL